MPYVFNGKKIPGDPRHGTRWATEEERALAGRALMEMRNQFNRIVLVPAPAPHFDGHKIRVQESENPSWYRKFATSYWRSARSFQLKRCRVEKALKRVHADGVVRRNGYERLILPVLKEWETLQDR